MDLENNIFRVLNYGEPWKNLVGDNFVLSLVQQLIKEREQHKCNCDDGCKCKE